MDELINCTPHPITLVALGAGTSMTLPPSGVVLRVDVQQSLTPEPGPCGMPVVENLYGSLTAQSCDGSPADVPSPRPGVAYLVSLQVLQAHPRADFYAPDTAGGAVRDSQGRIVGVSRLVRAAPRG